MTVFDRSRAISEYPCIEDVDRNLWLPVPASGGTVLVAGASKKVPSLGLALLAAPLSISAATPARARRIWRWAVCANRAALGRVVLEHKGTYLWIQLRWGCREGFVRIGQWGRELGERHDSSANQSTRGGAKQHQQHPGAQSLQSPPPPQCTVLYCTVLEAKQEQPVVKLHQS